MNGTPTSQCDFMTDSAVDRLWCVCGGVCGGGGWYRHDRQKHPPPPTHTHTHLRIVQGRITGRYYRDNILTPSVVSFARRVGRRFVFLDDNVRSHRALIVFAHLQQHNIYRMPWPAMSPDLHDDIARSHSTQIVNVHLQQHNVYRMPWPTTSPDLHDDIDRSHRAQIVNAHLQQHNIYRMPWPAMSPDLQDVIACSHRAQNVNDHLHIYIWVLSLILPTVMSSILKDHLLVDADSFSLFFFFFFFFFFTPTTVCMAVFRLTMLCAI